MGYGEIAAWVQVLDPSSGGLFNVTAQASTLVWESAEHAAAGLSKALLDLEQKGASSATSPAAAAATAAKRPKKGAVPGAVPAALDPGCVLRLHLGFAYSQVNLFRYSWAWRFHSFSCGSWNTAHRGNFEMTVMALSFIVVSHRLRRRSCVFIQCGGWGVSSNIGRSTRGGARGV